MSMSEVRSVEDLMGHTCTSVVANNVEVIFTLEDGRRFKLYHRRSCCESVELEDICGDLNDLVGTKLLHVEEATSRDPSVVLATLGKTRDDNQYSPESETWTFYKFATLKGSVMLRWYALAVIAVGCAVDFVQIDAGDDE